jgi:cyclic pyranopterin phosphate synthase
MPRSVFGAGHAFAPSSELLDVDELGRVAAIFATLGVTKVRLTGGEPLLRRDLEEVVRRIAAIDGIDDIALTTNGSLLADRADALRRAGLQRVTVSLDSVDSDVFAAMSDTAVTLPTVLAGIEAARTAGLFPVKLNCVVRRGVNEGHLIDLVDFARREGYTLRFIEYMDVGGTNGWTADEVVPAAEILDRVGAVYPLEPLEPTSQGEVARRWRFRDGAGELGVIASVTEPFCTDCTRARVTATGELFTCLFATRGRDLRALLRSEATDDDIRSVIEGVWSGRTDRYSQLRSTTGPGAARAEMSYLGG